MGTSSSHPGSNDRTPLVPPHADAEPGKPLPKPEPFRFRQFRTDFGHYAQSGDKSYLEKGLNNFVRRATGGPSIGPRRYGAAITAGGALVTTLSLLGSGQLIGDQSGLTKEQQKALNSAVGQPIDVAIDILSETLAPIGEESEKVRSALNYALSESLEELDDSFSSDLLNEELYIQTLISFLAEVIFQDIVVESKDAFEKASSPEILERREEELRELVNVAIDKHLNERLDAEVSNLSLQDIKDVQYSAIKDVFSEWDELE